jgi:hypothetical protein
MNDAKAQRKAKAKTRIQLRLDWALRMAARTNTDYGKQIYMNAAEQCRKQLATFG